MKLLILLVFCHLLACQKAPVISLAADNLSPLTSPPMGAKIYNDEFKSEILALNNILENLNNKEIEENKNLILQAKSNNNFKLNKNNYYYRVFMTMPELIYIKNLSELDKDWCRAKFYFLRRRFIESAMMLSDILEKKPDFHEARNWRARAIFFLGNPDMALSELNNIKEKSPKNSNDYQDALYLTGAIIYEANEEDKQKIQTAIKAWESYALNPSLDENGKKEIHQGLAELVRRLKGETKAELNFDPFAPKDSYSKEKNAILRAFQKEELLLSEELLASVNFSNDKELTIIKARLLLKNGQFEEAMKLFSEARERFKNYAALFHYQGMAFMMQGKIKEAVQSWQECFRLDKSYAAHHRLDQRIAVAESMMGAKKIETH